MRAVVVPEPGGPEALRIVDRPIPEPSPGEVRLRVLAAGVNRPDVQQRRGLYPPPAGASDILGLDAAGLVDAVGPDVAHLSPGMAVCALLTGGGYADHCTVPAVQCLPVPTGLSFIEAAALPEVFFTAWNSMVWLGRLADRETVMLQGGTSGVGLAAIQIAKQLFGATVIATSSSDEKREVCRRYGADAAISYKGDWPGEVRRFTGERGVDLVLDGQAGPYTDIQLDLLALDGRVVLLASHLGPTAEVNVRAIVRRRLTLTGATIRPRPPAYKARIAAELKREVWPRLESRAIRMPVCATFELDAVQDAHRLLDANGQIGKVVLTLDPAASTVP